jgi:chromosomal replication initiator protein
MEKIWNKCCVLIEQKVGESTYNLWFKSIKAYSIEEDKAVLIVPNRFYLEWIDNNYPDLIKKALSEITQKDMQVTFELEKKMSIKKSEDNSENNNPEVNKISRPKIQLQKAMDRPTYLSLRYTFDQFVVGPSNQFAHAAAQAVSESPGKAYNPLFIYGDVGLGKTHLITAIGNKVIKTRPELLVIFVQSEQFTNEVVTAIRHEKMSEFKAKYRNVDLLLIDDVQFIANKTQTQEEFFHTFNALYEMQKQIVISSDRPPKEIGAITDRLKSRFTMGLIADIQPPSEELKVAILHKKAAIEKIRLPDDVAFFLASRIRSNIRELEGCLIKLAAHSTLIGSPINLDMSKQVLKDVFYDDDKPITIDFIQKKVCDVFGVKLQDIKAKKRTKELTVPRQVAMFLSKRLTDCSLSEIGKAFGGKDHATVIYSCKKVEERAEKEESFNRIVEQLSDKIKY